MNCLEFRRSRLSDPNSNDPVLLAHRGECAPCRAFEAGIHELDGKIAKAFAVDVPEGLAARIMLNRSLKSRTRRPTVVQWLSMAASLFLAVSLLALWSLGARPEVELVRHMEMERSFVDGTLMPVHEPQLRQVLNSVNLEVVGSIGDVQFASTCVIDGQLVAHLVIRDADGELTVLLLPAHLVDEDREFARDAWKGLITPGIEGGSVAVMASGAAPVDYNAMRTVVRRVSRSITPIKA